MKKIIFVLISATLLFGCSKYNQKHLPVSATYFLKGTADTILINGFPEIITGGGSTRAIIISGRTAFGHSPNGDTLFKDMWTGDVLSMRGGGTYTAIYYKASGSSGYLVDSSSNLVVSTTIGSNY